MSASESSPEQRRKRKRTVRRRVRRAVGFLIKLVFSPALLYMSFRRSVTAASVTVLLAMITTLNVVWGFPWSGLMGAFTAILVGGWSINRLMRPDLQLSLSLPRSAIAGEPFAVTARLTNRRFLPALDLRIGWHREGIREVFSAAPREPEWDASPPVSIGQLRSGGQVRWQGAMRFDRRGVHRLPAFQVTSSFPFFFFNDRHGIDPETEIAITPAPIASDDDPMARMMLSVIGDWTKQLVVGAPVEYIGNREYQEGMQVRKWDFASWARLGRPIVREYQSPSVQAITLIIDTSTVINRNRVGQTRESDEAFERLMSIAATAVMDISARRVHLQLRVTSQQGEAADTSASSSANDSCESMLVQLAGAEAMDAATGQDRLIEILENTRPQPILVLSLVDLDSSERTRLANMLPSYVNYAPIGRENEAEVRRSA